RPEVYEELWSYYSNCASQTTDELYSNYLQNLAHYCLIELKQTYEAFVKFTTIVQEYPNTELAFYAELDAYYVSLLMQQNGISKTGLYAVSGFEDYNKKVHSLLQKRGKGGVEATPEIIPDTYSLLQNYPNPFNPATTIKFNIPVTGNVSLKVYDILGREVITLVDEVKTAGSYSISFNASKLSSGIYFYRMQSGKFTQVNKMVILK
ncbi:MAG: T9SS type A sorting domain-containing protein, partial [Ignavibacteriales bacterium]|nr:T9SS type A sorting domain-containing protein [Ignavibacteriales bacterium]